MVARALHEASPRKGGPFLALNCGAIPENLIESTLFGHERGAFTGADRQSRGYFQAADGGTLLLDEIGELPLAMQSKLLRVLEDSQVTPVGTTAPQKVDVRIVAATNRDLEEEVAAGEFRQDLFFRLNIVNIRLPALRERPEDLPLLTRFFLDEICRTNNFEPREIDHSLLEAFQKYDWPGNVRELKNTLESLVVLSGRTTLTAEDLPEKFFREPGVGGNGERSDLAGVAESRDPDLNLRDMSKQTILKALEACRGNRTEAAKHLGISRRTLHRRLKEFGLKE
jgi:two-component system response regulator HydG